MKRTDKHNFTPEFRLESVQLLVGQNYSVKEATTAINARFPEQYSLVKK